MRDGGEGMRVVLFDVGGVLVTSRPDPARVAAILGMDTDAADSVELVDHAIWFNREAYDAGESDRTFWDTVAGDCGLGEVSDAVLARLVDEDVSRSDVPDPSAIDLARELHGAGLRLGILSNAPVAIADRIEHQPWVDGLFDIFVFSGPAHLTKPGQAIYRLAIERCAVPADQILFIDDRTPNLRAGQLAGMCALQWTDAGRVRSELEDRGILARAVAS